MLSVGSDVIAGTGRYYGQKRKKKDEKVLLQLMKMDPVLKDITIKWKTNFFGHFIRGPTNLLQTIMMGTVEGKRGQGRRRMS